MAGENLGQIDIPGDFKVRAEVDEHFLTRIIPGSRADCTIAGTDHRLRVSKIYDEVENGRLKLDLTFEYGVPKGLRRGQTLHLRLYLGTDERVDLLPTGGFYQSTGGQWVFVLDPSGTRATRRPVRIGRANPESYEIISGLKPGDRVITSSYESFIGVDRLILCQQTVNTAKKGAFH